MARKIRVGIIGANPARGWAHDAHIPALQALPDYEITALSTSRADSARAAAAKYGVAHAFDHHQGLVTCPEVDLVAVTVKVPYHHELVSAALDAGKHVYCEWPLGNGLAEAEDLAARARAAGVKAVVGLQARFSPAVRYVRQLVEESYVGRVLSTTLIGSGLVWGPAIVKDHAYVADRRNGATMLTIPVSHSVDALCWALGEFASMRAFSANNFPEITVVETGETKPKDAADQIIIAGQLTSGATANVHYRGGTTRGTGLLWEINGSEGDLQLKGPGGHLQMMEPEVFGGRGDDQGLKPLPVPAAHRWVPAALDQQPFAVNVAQAYAQFAEALANGGGDLPDFDDAVRRHRWVAAVEAAAETGTAQDLD